MEKQKNTERWDAIVKDLVAIVGEFARLVAAARGEREVVAALREAMSRATRAAMLALPLSRYGRSELGADRDS